MDTVVVTVVPVEVLVVVVNATTAGECLSVLRPGIIFAFNIALQRMRCMSLIDPLPPAVANTHANSDFVVSTVASVTSPPCVLPLKVSRLVVPVVTVPVDTLPSLKCASTVNRVDTGRTSAREWRSRHLGSLAESGARPKLVTLSEIGETLP